MHSTSIQLPAVRHLPGPRRRHPVRAGLADRRAQLEARWRERLERVTALSVAYHDEAQRAARTGGDGSGGSRRARLLARRAVAERQALAEIEAALERITSGQYGWCEQCRRPIAAALLAVAPQVRYCAGCRRRTTESRASVAW